METGGIGMEKPLIVIPVCNDGEYLKEKRDYLNSLETGDVLIVDDGSEDNTRDLVEGMDSVKYICHEISQGYGSALLSGLSYARDLSYPWIITLDIKSRKIGADITVMIENLQYGYDIVSCSRILENYDHTMIPEEYQATMTQISEELYEVTEFNLTDPLTPLLALNMRAMKNMELTEFDHGILIQLWIQASYFGLEAIELPTATGSVFGTELELYEEPINHFISIIETEKYLYNRGSSH